MDYVNEILVLVSAILAVVLVYTTNELVGKEWLFASVLLSLVAFLAYQVIGIAALNSENSTNIYHWYDVARLLSAFSAACFGLFLFVVWSNTRLKLNIKETLFSFNGRISRSVFWIVGCIMFPLGMKIGYAPFTSQAVGIPKIILWIVYVLWFIPSIWISLALYTKRWHDCSKSGWMTLVLLIPIIGAIWFIAYLGFVKGARGSNAYGEDPLYYPEN